MLFQFASLTARDPDRRPARFGRIQLGRFFAPTLVAVDRSLVSAPINSAIDLGCCASFPASSCRMRLRRERARANHAVFERVAESVMN